MSSVRPEPKFIGLENKYLAFERVVGYAFDIVQRVVWVIFVLFLSAFSHAQSDLSPLLDTERSLERSAVTGGMKSAYLQHLADDSIIFRPGPTNGKDYWQKYDDPTKLLNRNLIYADIASNGLLGYTTGNWRVYDKGKSESGAKFGQYVTIWEKKPDGKFLATIDIVITHEKLSFAETDQVTRRKQTREENKRGWSPANESMSFTRLSMAPGALGGAYQQFAAPDIRLLRDGDPPIVGKKNVVKATRGYLSIRFPENISLFQAADLAYTWNPCEFANSQEGMEKGNCLHVWKLRDKKWWIVLSVFAKVPNETKPVLTVKPRNSASQ